LVTRLKSPRHLIFVIVLLSRLIASLVLASLALVDGNAQVPGWRGRPSPHPQARATPPMKKASELIKRQDPLNVTARLLEKVTPDNSRVRVSLSKQRAYLLLCELFFL
jgi:hypothetical protein